MNFDTLVSMAGSAMSDTAQTAQNTADAVRELSALKAELKQTRQELADYKAEQDVQRAADHEQAIIDQKKNRRDLYISTAFSVCFTLFLEHLPVVVHFAKLAFESFVAFLH